MKQFLLGILLPLSILPTSVIAAPKYGPNAVPLSRKSNLEYFQKHEAPDFWALIPFYLPQPTNRACGATSLALVMNAARSSTELTSDQKLLTATRFVQEYTDSSYEKTILGSGPFERNSVTNKNMARLMELAAEKLKFKTARTRAEVIDINLKNLILSKKKFVDALRENEKSSNDFIVISFVQGILTGDPEGGPHAAVIGAFDEQKGLVLIMDPDRDWYEPYWSPVEKVFDAIKDPRSDGLHPGWIHFQIR